MSSAPLILPTGYGFRRPSADEVRTRGGLDTLAIFEPPRRRGPRRYVISADVSDGLGLDRSSVDVIRAGTIEEPAEQVAHYLSDQVAPTALAYTIQALGEYYRDEDGVPALVAIECNNHGLSTQDTLQLHLGYAPFYIWEYYDAEDPARRYSTKIGWMTTTRTRPLLLAKFRDALVTTDPVTGLSDLILHSPWTLEELKDFQTEGALWEAAAARGAHDDCVMSVAIGYYVAWRLQAGETEPLEERRRRRSEQRALQATAAGLASGQITRRDWRNSPASSEDPPRWGTRGSDDDEEDLDLLLYDPTAPRLE